MPKALISDLEVFCPLGESFEEFSRGLLSMRSGICGLGEFYGQDFPVLAAGLIPSLNGKRDPNGLARRLLDKIMSRHPGKKIDGVIFFVAQEDELVDKGFPPTVDELIAFFRQSVASERWAAIGEACVSGLSGLAMAAQRVRSGLWKNALVLGVDLRCSPLDILRLHALAALSVRRPAIASSPFSVGRDGFVKSQGAAAFLIEANPAVALAEISGYGQTSDCWRMTEGRPDGDGILRAMEQALRIGEIERDGLDIISAHATSTPLGDALEARAIGKFWDEHSSKPPVTALKSQLGHSILASGLLQVAGAITMLQEQCLLPILNFREPDPGVNLRFAANEVTRMRVRRVLCNASAFGGSNASLLISEAGRKGV